MAPPLQLSLDCKPLSYSMLLKSFGEQTQQTQKLEEFLARLEEERVKIDAFKRELPLCMQLLTNAMEASRQQLQSFHANQGARPVLEEFIPLKHASHEESPDKAANISADMANWMTSAQLWSQASDHVTKQPSTTSSSPKETDNRLDLDSKHRNGGAFLPFSKDRSSSARPTLRTLPELALVSSDKGMEDEKKIEIDARSESFGKGNNGVAMTESQSNAATTTTTTQTQRKARRCWSPDLHRRFVNALHMLGGSQVATPKQIRELMKKYRLHTRRPCPSPQTAATPPTQLVVLGGIWVPPEYAATAHGVAPAALYGPPHTTHASPHYCASPMPQEFYPAPTPPNHHHQLQLYGPHLRTQNSPKSEARGDGDRSESIEDDKSESISWKADSGAEMEGKERLWSSEKQEKLSSGSEISLKF